MANELTDTIWIVSFKTGNYWHYKIATTPDIRDAEVASLKETYTNVRVEKYKKSLW